MAITKESYDRELQPFYLPGKLWAAFLAKRWGVKLINRTLDRFSQGNNIQGLDCEQRHIPSRNNGPDIRIRIFRPKGVDKPLPGMLYNHGGGYMLGNPEQYHTTALKRFIDTRPCVIVAADYRKSIKNPYPDGFNDCYDTLLWLNENAELLGIIPAKYINAGYSAGGGLTAAVTLKARDTKDVNIAFQMPFYPMLDDRCSTESFKTMVEATIWNSKNTTLGWDLYLHRLHESNQPIPVYASPARNTDYTDFPPTITFVGEMEPFRDETIAYVDALKQAGVPVHFELFKGAFHGFETVANKAEITKRANDFQFQAYAEFYDKYFTIDSI